MVSGNIASESNSDWLAFRRKNDRLIMSTTGAAHPIARVIKHDEEHEPDQNHSAGGLQSIEHRRPHGTTPHRLINRQDDMPAVQHRKRQEIEQREVHIEYHTEPQDQTPAVFALKEICVETQDHHRAAKLLNAHFALS